MTAMIDDVFGDLDLDDLEAEVEQVATEDVWARHDRIKAEMQALTKQAEKAKESWDYPALSSYWLGYSGEALLRRAMRDAFPTPESVWDLHSSSSWHQNARQSYFARSVRNEEARNTSVEQRITRALYFLRRDLDLIESASEAVNAYEEALAAANAAGFPVGAVVTFSTTRGQNRYSAQGVVREITANNYIVKIDSANSAWEMRDQETARIKIRNATRASYYGGRQMSLVWGPSHAQTYLAEEAKRREEAARKAERERAAQEMRDAARRAWNAVEYEHQAYEQAVKAIPGQAAAKAVEALIARHSEEFASLVASLHNGLLTQVAQPTSERYQAPSSDWRDYLAEVKS